MSRYSVILFVFLAGCATKTVSVVSRCQSADWFELGRQDGASGEPAENLEERKKECSVHYTEKAGQAYLNGRERGLVEFCTPENGVSIGRRGELYYYVCPYNLEAEFLTGFKRGKRILALERANQDLDRKLADLTERLNRAPASAELQSEVEQLRKLRAQNEREKSQLEVLTKSNI